MITKFDNYSGVINININGKKLYFHLNYNENKIPFEIKLKINEHNYDNLSVIVPDSKKLKHKEFFINPKLNNNIIKTLIKENFIQESGKTTFAGDNETKSYILLI
jgi:hypothetical protein